MERNKAAFLDRHAEEIEREFRGCSVPLDLFLDRYFKARHYLGARDRRLLRERVYGWVRGMPWPDFLRADYRPEYDREAPIAIRVNRLKTTSAELLERFSKEGVRAFKSAWLPDALILDKRYPVQTLDSYREGCFELQDEGSQFIAHIVGAGRGDRVLDFCAGAGGKTLDLAAHTRNAIDLVAYDREPRRLLELKRRASRAGVTCLRHVTATLSDLAHDEQRLDRVLVDAPCSGLGTLRRNPDLRLRVNEGDIARYAETQGSLLDAAARFVATNGVLVYVTCSFKREENEAVVESFLERHAEFKIDPIAERLAGSVGHAVAERVVDGPYLKTAPTPEGGPDGFFAARLVCSRVGC